MFALFHSTIEAVLNASWKRNPIKFVLPTICNVPLIYGFNCTPADLYLQTLAKTKTDYNFYFLQNITAKMSKRTSNWFLKHIKTNSKYFLKYGCTNIGRATHCDIRIPENDISRNHCTVDVLENDIVHICDLSVSLKNHFNQLIN